MGRLLKRPASLRRYEEVQVVECIRQRRILMKPKRHKHAKYLNQSTEANNRRYQRQYKRKIRAQWKKSIGKRVKARTLIFV